MAYNDTPKGDAPDFTYTIYIAASIDSVWDGLVKKEMTEQYWGRENKSDWKTGSKWEHIRTDGSNIVDVYGQVIAYNIPTKLSVTWNGLDGSKTQEPAPSVVTFDLVKLGPDTKLSLTHSQLTKDSMMYQGVIQGWPAILSNLKSLLETGDVMSEDKWGDAKQDHPDDE